MSIHNIPNELKASGRFCVWKYEKAKNGRITKVPYNAITGRRAKANDISTFCDYDTAVAVAQSGSYDGVGLGIFGVVCAIDIDDCVKPDGVISDMAQDIIAIMKNAYVEFSPSSTGIRILFTAKNFDYDTKAYYINHRDIGLEVYVADVTNKYVTVTGNVISAGEYGDRTNELKNVLDKYMKRKQDAPDKKFFRPVNVPSMSSPSDGELIEKAKAAKNGAKFTRLYNGDTSDYASHSEADLALCCILAFWCGCNAEQMDRLFRGSGLYREKWDSPRASSTYGRGVIETAISNCAAVCSPDSVSRLKPKDFTDVGQARVLSSEYRDKLRFSRATKWLHYNGMVWREEELRAHGLAQSLTERQLEGALDRYVQAKQDLDSAKQNGDSQEIESAKIAFGKAERYYNFVLSRRDTNKITAMLKEAQPMLQIDIKALDADGYKLNTLGGTVDLRTGEMLSHNPADYCTKITAASPSDEGTELFEAFLKVIACGDESLVIYLQLIAGMFAVGKVLSENLVIAYGSGRNGKSTFFNLLARVLGDYSGNLSAETLTVNCRKNKSPEYAELRGKRFVIAAELEEGMRLDTAIVKKLCSTDEILAEKKYKDPFGFKPSHTLVLYTNHLPRVGTSDDGTWRRLIVIPFNAVIEGKSDKKNYADYLFKNAGGATLAWIIEGARMFIAAGGTIEPPECVKQAVESYRGANDWLGDYISEQCIVSPTCKQEAGKLYEDYRNYCDRVGDYKRGSAEFKAALEGTGCAWKRTNEGRFYFGLSLKPVEQTQSVKPFRHYVQSQRILSQVLSPAVTDGDGERQNFSNEGTEF